MRILSIHHQLQTPTAIALGNFDGIHQGHQRVLRQLVTQSHQAAPPLHPAVVSFSPHPKAFFSGQSQALLTPAEEKAALLDALSIEQLVLLPFNQDLAQLSPEAFVTKILLKTLHVQHISVGADFRFGYQRQGTINDLRELGQNYNFQVTISDLLTLDQQRVSSSRIREALTHGELDLANHLLGRPYELTGTVVKGQQLGRTLGFPTANLALPADKLRPKYGVYAGWVTLPSTTTPLAAVLNIGERPTVNGVCATAEVHLLDWSGDLYDQKVSFHLEHYLRPEQKFSGLPALKQQITLDCQQARQLLQNLPNLIEGDHLTSRKNLLNFKQKQDFFYSFR